RHQHEDGYSRPHFGKRSRRLRYFRAFPMCVRLFLRRRCWEGRRWRHALDVICDMESFMQLNNEHEGGGADGERSG
ncbi:unnamed protein product, partial [Ectocarpus fasciculatus]